MKDEKKVSERCCECVHWKTNVVTQKTGMASCSKKKKYTSYQEVCPGFLKFHMH